MSISYELSEAEFEAVRDAKNLVSLVEALAANAAMRIDITREELCALTTVVIGKLSSVLDASETRRSAEQAFASSQPLTPTQQIIDAHSNLAPAADAKRRSVKRARREATAVA